MSYLLNYLHTHVTNVLLHICKLCRILHVLITMYTSSLDQKSVGKNSSRNICHHNRCWNSYFNNDFWNICSDKSCWNSHQRNFVPAFIVKTLFQQSVSQRPTIGNLASNHLLLTKYRQLSGKIVGQSVFEVKQQNCKLVLGWVTVQWCCFFLYRTVSAMSLTPRSEALPLHKLYACVSSNSFSDSSETTSQLFTLPVGQRP